VGLEWGSAEQARLIYQNIQDELPEEDEEEGAAEVGLGF